MKSITCPECKNTLQVEDSVKVGDVKECEFCGVELEMTNVSGEVLEFEMLEEEK
ncbi:hypothetical protein KC660_00925 [Candidatus Dojkabacteria bacterium]|uniref:Lysine biosynthesis protein LysW n=1 Tax=Candidatus Dojkabacteria bacterium TaxID=2099670 RepID=A0A955L2Y7_9BACT|nr:hypothetical protein [Candidatus Dojkabacteria bacterium]